MFTNDFIRYMHFVFLLVHLFLTFETEGLKLLVITNKLLVGLTYFHDSVRKICIVGNFSTLIVSCEKIQYVFSLSVLDNISKFKKLCKKIQYCFK